MAWPSVVSAIFLLLHAFSATAQIPVGFISLDCGGKHASIDRNGLQWIPDDSFISGGFVASISVTGETRKHYQTVRYFPADERKYCYTLHVKERTRYLVRATFLYGNFDKSSTYPTFDISLGATYWSTVAISDIDIPKIKELILLAQSSSISVCLSNASTGTPFISTLELRQFNGSMYYTDFETQFFLHVSARINFGASNNDSIRYPDDPYDRIWESDADKRANFLVDVASGTTKIQTNRSIDTARDEYPPEKVMQTAVVGERGLLSYRTDLDGFPGYGWAFSYFAEIEDLGPREARKFKLNLPNVPDYNNLTINVQENAQGSYKLYEPGYANVSLPFVVSFAFVKKRDSSRGPILNALEVNKYVTINFGTQDAAALSSLIALYPSADWALEGGDPCLPVPWTWVRCSSDGQPRVTAILLSGKNLSGQIPLEILNLTALTDLLLDHNSLNGPIPDFSALIKLQRLHLEDNQLKGSLPVSLADLPDLKELYVQNNSLSGSVSHQILDKSLILNYSGNANLIIKGSGRNHVAIIASTIGAFSLLSAVAITVFYVCFWRHSTKEATEKSDTMEIQTATSHISVSEESEDVLKDITIEMTHCFTLAELEVATEGFKKKIGSGGFGPVYYGTTKDGKEVAVKVLSSDSQQGKREFLNEVALMSRIHHRNLVALLGYCQDQGKNILVYEYMHNGTLREHLHGSVSREHPLDWISRLELAEDAAKGIEYLHTGCNPSIIHRDLKSSNILLDNEMRAKVSDFGLSRLAANGTSHISSIVRGTVGYLDPEYYVSQQLTEKSDVYSFGVVLLEMLSGQEAISNESFGVEFRNIVQWARFHIDKGDIQRLIDPALGTNFNIQSVWKIAEKAMLCVQPYGKLRPTMSDVVKEIQEAINIEKEPESSDEEHFDMMSRHSRHSSLISNTLDSIVSDPSLSLDDSIILPSAR
ncbi:probable LRR receptor-like serine/threonine-protein kinase At1g67720 isoform X2 [Cryptomeria japonica]|uniref:probable LRR receptor-like serine/threonine-protein kinase At1g67720 isoform X2 n=1 Tax=Cryptomeria japonica TaxID=3369 RepID=UPI0027DAB4E5|nr:probable LRR receptor-like serine/threonine-protein kinase At1g67720 isoform X2 [Cryptomeria japonica]